QIDQSIKVVLIPKLSLLVCCFLSNFAQPAIPKFDDKEAYQKKLEELKLKDIKAKRYLFQEIDRNPLDTILQNDTLKQIWNCIKKKYHGSTRVKKKQLQAIHKEFEILHMNERQFVDEYFFNNIFNSQQNECSWRKA
ncbi:hypothetical protein CR513_03301, partial [Mucuna pruriens]